MSPRVSVVIPVYNEGDYIIPVLDRLFEAITLPCEVLVVYDDLEDTTRPGARAVHREGAPPRADAEHLRAAGPAHAIRYGLDHASSPVLVVTMADGCDDAMQIDTLTRLVERGVVVACGVALHARRAAGRRPGRSRASCRGWPATRCSGSAGSAPTTPPTRSRPTRPTSCRRWGCRATGASRSASSSWPRPAGPACPIAEIPTIWLDRSFGTSNFKLRAWLPRYLRWYFFAFGKELTLEQVAVASAE